MKALIELILLLARELQNYVERQRHKANQNEAESIRSDPSGAWNAWANAPYGLLNDKPKAVDSDTPKDHSDRNL
jgi:hypothetical protein